MRKPFFRSERKAWFVWVDGRQVRLSEKKSEAHEIWRRMVARGNPEASQPFAALAGAYLAAAQKTLSPDRYAQVARYIASFSHHYQGPAEALRPYDVAEWLSGKDWGPTTRNMAVAIIKRLYSWAVEQGLADRSPIAGMRKDTEQRRERIISREEHAALVAGASPAFRPYLIALWLSGQRPGTVATVEASQVRDSRWVIERHKTRGKTGKPLVVYLSPCLATLTRIAAERRRRLFATAEPKPMRRTLARLRDRLGMDKAITSYSYRHAYATQALLTQSPATVAALLGHTSPRMVMERYGHVEQASEHLADAAGKVRLPPSPGFDK
jgi:integrase